MFSAFLNGNFSKFLPYRNIHLAEGKQMLSNYIFLKIIVGSMV